MGLMMLSLTAFSQTGTNNQVKCFPAPVVKQIMKDLLIGDQAKAQLKLSDSLLVLTPNTFFPHPFQHHLPMTISYWQSPVGLEILIVQLKFFLKKII